MASLPDYYAVLGLDRGACLDDIRKAHRRLVLEHHPDKGGSAATFKSVNEAYDTLRDPDRRAAYDAALRGSDGDAMGDGSLSPLVQLFQHAVRNMVQSHHGKQRSNTSNRLYKNAPVVATASVPISYVYTGGTLACDADIQDICSLCLGSGSSCNDRASSGVCNACMGLGFVDFTPWITEGPRVISPATVCRHCSGTGAAACPPESRCPGCRGSCTVTRRVRLTVDLPAVTDPGTYRAGQQLSLARGQGGYSASCRADRGDVVLRSLGLVDPTGVFAFSDSGHLTAKCTISLVQCLRRHPIMLLHPRGTLMRLRPPQRHIIQPYRWYVVRGQGGMKVSGSDCAVSDLCIDFNVQMPESLDSPAYLELKRALLSDADDEGENGSGGLLGGVDFELEEVA